MIIAKKIVDLSPHPKELLRREVQRRKELLTQDEILTSNKMIFKNLISLLEYQKAQTVFCFAGRDDEIDTRPILEHALHSGKQVGIPRILSPGVMRVYAISSVEGLLLNRFGILEPIPKSKEIRTERIDFAVIPCLATDLRGNRLGFGGGYYDRYLANAGFAKAVVCRETLLCDEVPKEPWDVLMDIVVTEKRMVRMN